MPQGIIRLPKDRAPQSLILCEAGVERHWFK